MSEAHPLKKDPIEGDPVADARVQIAKVDMYAADLLPDAGVKKLERYLDAAKQLQDFANEYPPSEKWNVAGGPIELLDRLTSVRNAQVETLIRDTVMAIYVQTGRCETAALHYARNDGVSNLAEMLIERARRSGTTELTAQQVRTVKKRWGAIDVWDDMSVVSTRERQQKINQEEFAQLFAKGFVWQAEQFATAMAETDPLMQLDAARCAVIRGEERAGRDAAEGVRKALQDGRILSEELGDRLSSTAAEMMLGPLAHLGSSQPSALPLGSFGSRNRGESVVVERRERCAFQFLSIVGSEYPEANLIAASYYAETHRYSEAVRHLTGYKNAIQSRQALTSQENFDGLVADLVGQACTYYQTAGGGSMSPAEAEVITARTFLSIDPRSECILSLHALATGRPDVAVRHLASYGSRIGDPSKAAPITVGVLTANT